MKKLFILALCLYSAIVYSQENKPCPPIPPASGNVTLEPGVKANQQYLTYDFANYAKTSPSLSNIRIRKGLFGRAPQIRIVLQNINPFLYKTEINSETFELNYNDTEDVISFFMPTSIADNFDPFMRQFDEQLIRPNDSAFVRKFIEPIKKQYQKVRESFDKLRSYQNLKSDLLLIGEDAHKKACEIKSALDSVLVTPYEINASNYSSIYSQLWSDYKLFLEYSKDYDMAFDTLSPDLKKSFADDKKNVEDAESAIKDFDFPAYITDVTAIYRSSDPLNWIIYSGPTYANDDELDFSIKITPKSDLTKYDFGVRSESFTIHTWTPKPKLTFSAGLFGTNFRDDDYTTVEDNGGAVYDTTYKLGPFGYTDTIKSIDEIKMKKIIKSDQGTRDFGYGVMAHLQYPIMRKLAVAASVGTMVNNNIQLRTLFGASFIYGYEWRVALNFGYAMGFKKTLQDGWSTDTDYPTTAFTEVPTKNVLTHGLFYGVTFNFKLSRSSKEKSNPEPPADSPEPGKKSSDGGDQVDGSSPPKGKDAVDNAKP